ncbi:RNA polymerase sigma factor [Horticoccus sp. 23ND18S-11]|uniref:RNA polymerase sigma factor n=1 Tax=Horticoccus sp. 23ND18S-11 TaxID=3391832 RepID=UPI0039C8C5CC
MHDETFPALVEAYYAPLYRFALSLAKNSSDAGDLTQQTFYVWARKGDALRDKSKARSWLFTTLYREFLRTRRRGNRITAIEALAPGQQDMADAEVDLVARLDAPLVIEALQEVDDAFREPLAFFYLQELSYREIAEILGLPIGTVMSRLSRGKAQLRVRLAEKSTGGSIIEFPRKNARP